MTRALSEREHSLMVDATDGVWGKYRDEIDATQRDANLFSRVARDFEQMIPQRVTVQSVPALPDEEIKPLNDARWAAENAKYDLEAKRRSLEGCRDAESDYAIFLAGEREGVRLAVSWLSRLVADPATAAMNLLSALHQITSDEGIDSLVTAEAFRSDAAFPHVTEDDEKPADPWEDFRERAGVRIIDDKIFVFGERAICVPGAASVMLPFAIPGLTARYDPEEDRLMVAFREKWLTKTRVAGLMKEDHKDPYLRFHWGNAGRTLVGFSISPFAKPRGYHSVSERLNEVLTEATSIIGLNRQPEASVVAIETGAEPGAEEVQ